MNGPQDDACYVAGSENLADVASADQICRKFKQSMSNALAVDRYGDIISVALMIEKDGTITAQLTLVDTQQARTFFEVAVDVMDRSLRLSDIDLLGKAAAEVLNNR